MTQEQAVPLTEPTCPHISISTFGDGEGGPRLWACAECRIRFYPACTTCVDVGHRNIEHPEAYKAGRDGLDVERASVLIDEFTTYLYKQREQLAANAAGDAEPCGWNVHAEVDSIRTAWINLVDKHEAWHLATPSDTPKEPT